jgi:hypothetical protein
MNAHVVSEQFLDVNLLFLNPRCRIEVLRYACDGMTRFATEIKMETGPKCLTGSELQVRGRPTGVPMLMKSYGCVIDPLWAFWHHCC